MIRKFGALRDVHDVRDRMYRASRLAPAVPLHVYLREWGGPIKDQGEESSCTGHAFSSAREWIARKYEKASPIPELAVPVYRGTDRGWFLPERRGRDAAHRLPGACCEGLLRN